MSQPNHSGFIHVHVDFPWVEMGVVIVVANIFSMLMWVTCYHAMKGASKVALYVIWACMLVAAVLGIAMIANSFMNGSLGDVINQAWYSRFTDGVMRAVRNAIPVVFNNNNNGNGNQLTYPNYSNGPGQGGGAAGAGGGPGAGYR